MAGSGMSTTGRSLLLNIHLEAQLKWAIFMAGTPTSQPTPLERKKSGAGDLVTL